MLCAACVSDFKSQFLFFVGGKFSPVQSDGYFALSPLCGEPLGFAGVGGEALTHARHLAFQLLESVA